MFLSNIKIGFSCMTRIIKQECILSKQTIIQKCLAIPETKYTFCNFYTGWYKQVHFDKLTLYIYCL